MIVKKVNSKVSLNYYKLCLTEKLFIIKSVDDCNLLNKDLNLLVNADVKISCCYVILKKVAVWIDVFGCILYLYVIFAFCLY